MDNENNQHVNFENILTKSGLLSNINLISVYIILYEEIRKFILEKPLEFFSQNVKFCENGERFIFQESEEYKRQVLTLDKNKFKASLL